MRVSVFLTVLWPAVLAVSSIAAEPARPTTNPVRIAAAQPRSRLVDWHIREPMAVVLAQVNKSLGELEAMIDKAADQHCDVIAFPEDTLGLGHWEAGNGDRLAAVLPEAVKRMLDRFGRAAAAQRMYVICSSDTLDADGAIRNTAFLLGRDGKEIGRYHKVNMPIHELNKKRGDSFPVFDTPDLGGVGMLICYDMVFPEAPRCLALAGADIIFHVTLGGAAVGDDDINRAAIRTRAVENFVYVIVAQRGSGSLIVSPQGKIIAEANGLDSLAIADIDPRGGREGGDAMNHQRDMRARLFRERNPAAFGMLTEANPPVLAKVPATISIPDAVRIAGKTLTIGQEEFQAADALVRAGKTDEAIAAFERLSREYPATWIDRVARQRLEKLRPPQASASRDWPIPFAQDARRIYREDYESGRCERIQEGSSAAVVRREDGADVHGGRYCLRGNFDTKTTDPLTRKRGKTRYAGLSDIQFTGIKDKLYVSYWWRLDADDKFEAEPPSNFGGQKHAYITGTASPWANKVNYVVGQAWGPEHWWIVNNSPNTESKSYAANARVDKPMAKLGMWHHIEFYLQLESAPAKADGIAILKIDGKLCIYQKDVSFQQGLPGQSWDRMALPSMFGGGTGPRESFGWQLDDLEVWNGLPQPADTDREPDKSPAARSP